MSNSVITVLESKQTSLFSLVQNLYDLSQKAKTDPAAAITFKIRLLTLDKTRDDYIQVLEQLNNAKVEEDPVDYVPNFKALETFDELYCHIKATAEMMSKPEKKPEFIKPKHKLPVLELVSFNGDPSTWPLFFQNFKEMIHENGSLTDAERIQYLISKLSGSALSITAGVLPVASNYKIIWNLLVEKYQDPRLLASQYFDKVLNFKALTTPSAQNLELFLEQFCASVTALKQSEITDLSDYMLLHIALNKLDKETVTLFEQRFGKEKIPTFKSLQEFVKEQRKVACHIQLHSTPLPSTASSSRVVNNSICYKTHLCFSNSNKC
ncbi:hypothetical protein NE865_13686 [Phthorimaea operculella]|nr:hypothetical protein NE865_13686 [Phthorimaea operculella]